MLTAMMNKTIPNSVSIVIAVALATLAGCSDQGAVKGEASKPADAQAAPPLASGHDEAPAALPPGHPPVDSAGTRPPGLPPVPEGAGTGATGLAWTAPPGWISETPSSPMRRAQYRVPGEAGDGECAVFYFGPGQGGDPMSNAVRWAEQFKLPDGRSARGAMKTSEIEVAGLKVFMVEVAGTYNGGMTMTSTPATPKPGYRLLGAVAPGPDANWFFKFTGPDRTVNEQRAGFTAMVKSLKHGAS
jgi:hypothetical protein